MSTARVTNLQNEASSVVNLALDASGNVTIGNNLTVTGTTTQTGSTTLTGSASVGGNVTIGGATFSPSTPASGSVAMTGTLSMGSSFLRNRIINGDMRIDQRNAGASVTVNSASAFYPVDRWQAQGQSTDGVFTVQQSSTAPADFKNSVIATVTTADSSLGATQYYLISHRIEGYNVADLNWGSANAKTVTLSFWARSSVTGTFGGSLVNSALNRSYPFTYTINSANTFEYKTITIAGDTTGTWVTDNGIGVIIYFGLGVGSTYSGTAGSWGGAFYASATGATNLMATLNATLYITGAQFEVGSVATPFERRQYGTELMLCQRYYEQIDVRTAGLVFAWASESVQQVMKFTVEKRAAPTCTFSFSSISNYQYGGYTSPSASLSLATTSGARLSYGIPSNWANSGAAGYILSTNNSTYNAMFSAEL